MSERIFEMPVRVKYRKYKDNYWAALLELGCEVEVFRLYRTAAWEGFLKRPLQDGELLKLCLVVEEEPTND